MSEQISLPNEEQIKMVLEAALKQLKEKDTYLLKHDVNERSITHRLAMYLQDEIDKLELAEKWFVDCEYNRDSTKGEINTKKIILLQSLKIPQVDKDDKDAKTIFPDIIVHRRGYAGENDGNLLVIEAKKDTSKLDSKDYDLKKLEAYCSTPPEGLNYKFAALVIFKVDQEKSKENCLLKSSKLKEILRDDEDNAYFFLMFKNAQG